MSRASDDVLAERRRQIDGEGWTPAHDERHAYGELALAAVCYALPPWFRDWFDGNDVILWPWDNAWWKPKDRRRDLVRAGALIIAEIERLDRATPAEGGEHG